MNTVEIGKNIRISIKQGNLEQVIQLIGDDKSVLSMMTPFGSWLHVAADQGQLDIVKKLLDLGVDINLRGGIAGGNALREAADKGHLEIVDYLLSKGAEMDSSEPERNPLFAAIREGNTMLAKYLIEHDIDVNAEYDTESKNALGFAKKYGRTEIVELLIQKGCK